MRWLTRLKNFLKKFLPPPVNAFNREMGALRKFVEKQIGGLRSVQYKETEQVLEILAQQQKLINIQQWQLETMAVKLQDSLAAQQILRQQLVGLEGQILGLDKFAVLEESLRTRLVGLEKQLLELDKFAVLEESLRTRLVGLEKQLLELDKFSILEKSLRTSIVDGNTQVTKTFTDGNAQVTKILTDEQTFIKESSNNISKYLSDHSKMLVRLPGISGQLTKIELGAKRTTPQPRLSYFVLNILDHCNLRCKGCDHFACIAEERFVSVEDIKRDVVRMSELTHEAVTRIGVMGGEPLLHPNLVEILNATRKAFPNTLIQLVTNGLLLLRMSEEFWICCHENNIVIINTKYPINQDYERMQKTAQDYDVKFEFYGNTGEFVKTSYKNPMDINGRQNPIDSFWTCYHANSLPLLMEGKFYACTIAPNAQHFNKKFGTSMELQTEDYLDIYKAQGADDVYNFLAVPKPFCRYCMTSKRTFGHPWERSKQEMSEWLPD